MDFDAIARSLHGAPVRLSGKGIGAVLSNDGREGWSEAASDVVIELDLRAEGLIFHYVLTLASRLVDQSVTLPWELLILRYPTLARRRPFLVTGTAGA